MSDSFSTLLDESLSTLDMQPGSIVSGVVLDVDNDWVTVHVGLKSEGVISLDEFRNNEGTVEINIGDEVEVALEAVEDGYGETRISREKARKISTWKMLEEALESGEFVQIAKMPNLDALLDGQVAGLEWLDSVDHLLERYENDSRTDSFSGFVI